MEVFSLASGSSGNCIYVGTNDSSILVDCGISGKRIEEGLKSKNINIKDIDAILITHEHSDHISGLGVISRRYSIPVYATKATIEAIKNRGLIGNVDYRLFNEIQKDSSFLLNNINIYAKSISHDAADPVAYSFFYNNKKLCIITDLGTYDKQVINSICNADILLIESNHDVRMLETGIYPYHLKQRILSNLGHLSNELCGKLISEVAHEGLKYIMLCHISKENNFPELALESVKMEITLSNNKFRANDFNIYVAPADRVSDTIKI